VNFPCSAAEIYLVSLTPNFPRINLRYRGAGTKLGTHEIQP